MVSIAAIVHNILASFLSELPIPADGHGVAITVGIDHIVNDKNSIWSEMTKITTLS
jgi:hypothetical protein